jgi:hypothetical protein
MVTRVVRPFRRNRTPRTSGAHLQIRQLVQSDFSPSTKENRPSVSGAVVGVIRGLLRSSMYGSYIYTLWPLSPARNECHDISSFEAASWNSSLWFLLSRPNRWPISSLTHRVAPLPATGCGSSRKWLTAGKILCFWRLVCSDIGRFVLEKALQTVTNQELKFLVGIGSRHFQ